MSQENVEVIKAAIDAFNRQDWEAVFQDAAPGAELDWSRGMGELSGVYKLDELRPVMEQFAEHWESLSIACTSPSKQVVTS